MTVEGKITGFDGQEIRRVRFNQTTKLRVNTILNPRDQIDSRFSIKATVSGPEEVWLSYRDAEGAKKTDRVLQEEINTMGIVFEEHDTIGGDHRDRFGTLEWHKSVILTPDEKKKEFEETMRRVDEVLDRRVDELRKNMPRSWETR